MPDEKRLGEAPAGENGTPVAVSVSTAEPVSAAAEGSETGGNTGSAGEVAAGGKPEIFDTPETVANILGRLDRIIETQERMIRIRRDNENRTAEAARFSFERNGMR